MNLFKLSTVGLALVLAGWAACSSSSSNNNLMWRTSAAPAVL